MHLFIYNLNFYLAILPAILSISMIGYCLFKGRKTKLLYSYILLLTIIVIFSVAWEWYQLARLVNNLQSAQRAEVLFTLAGTFLGYSWLLFYGLYTKSRLITKKGSPWLLLIPPSLLCFSLLTNDYHHLFFVSVYNYFRILYWINLAVIYIYVLSGIIMMITYAIKQMRDSRSQSILLIFSALIPLLGSLLEQLQIITEKGSIPFTQLSFSFSVILFGVISFKYRFLNIIPVAWQKIMNHMKESMIIIDRTNTIVNYNHAFENNFPELIQDKTGDLKIFTEKLGKNYEDQSENNRVITAIQHGVKDGLSGELTVITPEWKCFSVYIQSILSRRGEIQGRIVLFNEITHDKKLLQELQGKNNVMSTMNQELAAANEQLKNYARTMEELAVAQERNRMARDIHDSVGHNITLIIALLEVTADLYEQNRPETRAKLVEATGVARKSMQELRRSIHQKIDIQNLLDSLQTLIANFESSGIQIDFSVEGGADEVHPRYSEVVYRICQEALTNAVRHGKANQATIFLRLNPQTIHLYIFDNGRGCQTITKGMGLTGMEQRLQELNGTIEYGSSGECGFNINVKIPIF